ncbi:MAG TPA: LCP family protein [Candidatus Limnocylindrales bacterium]|nr:LCP family protein [Candidatus Limnocylindrales bacterium]
MRVKPKRKKRNWFLISIIVISLITFLFVILVTQNPTRFFAVGTDLTVLPSTERENENSLETVSYFDADIVNIVLLGFDGPLAEDEPGSLYRPDTIMIASINFNSREVSLVNIPRDSYVLIHGTTIYDKINHSYRHGHSQADAGEDPHKSGLRTTLLTIQDFLGDVPIHNYIVLKMDGVEDIVDSIGGVYHDVEAEVRNNFGRGPVVLVEKGYQRLDGFKFLEYIRNRADAQGGEKGRSERQQKMMFVLLHQLRQALRLHTIAPLYMAVRRNVETDLNISQQIAMAFLGLRLNPEQIEGFVFSGNGRLSARGGQNVWYLAIDEQARVDLIREAFGVDVEERPQITLPAPLSP